jgi:site-specific recombinase XerD
MSIRFPPSQRVTMMEALDAFSEVEMPSRQYQPATRRSYTHSLRRFLRSAPSLHYVDELDLASVERYQAVMEQCNWRVPSRRVALAAIKAFITYLEQHQLLSAPFSQQIVLPEIQRQAEPRCLSAAEYWGLVQQAAHRPRDVALLHVLRYTGIPLSALNLLTLDDLLLRPSAILMSDTSQPELHPQTDASSVSGEGDTLKGSRPAAAVTDVAGHLWVRRWQCPPYKLPLDGTTCRALVAYLRVRPPSTHPHLFLTRYARPLTPGAVQALVEKYAQRAGVMGANIRALQATHRTDSSPRTRRS